ncbi:F-box associated interaction domain [Arabidopsis suecica]|uniref:F-box associated interaction domain n=1 Tax=Arabidopsis suecica TaxID=45249 RepID=A0A8T2CLU2_ARASU|nr:F-box associated interaction domain [Arabidopsis suecica]
MKNVEQHFSEDLLITQSSNAVRNYSYLIPFEILIDIFSRVPARSIARFRCVSKLWESILGSPDFTELFLTKSVARPRLLFALEVDKELFVFSSPQPQNPDENSSLVATPYKYFPKDFPINICPPLNGLVFLQDLKRKLQVVYNPVTGESITLPEVTATTSFKRSYFGFDPISKKWKVLYMEWSRYGTPKSTYVLTLKTGKCLWRKIQDPVFPHTPTCDEICINGALYYGASLKGSYIYTIVCFDFRFEKFGRIKINGDHKWTLFNCKGKLGAHQYNLWGYEKLTLWVLEDAEKHKWSKSICILPSIVYKKNTIVGMTSSGELVFTPYACYLSNSFYIFFYNIEKKTYTRVNIKGFEEFKHQFTLVHTFLDFVENIKFI